MDNSTDNSSNGENKAPEQKPAEAVVQPQAPTVAAPNPAQDAIGNAPLTLVLQWLTYAFWGWLVLALFWLISSVFTHFLSNNSQTVGIVNDMIAYALAASVILLIIATVLDYFYIKREPLQKTKGSAIIMLIHTVIFALLGIGALIGGVFGFISRAMSSVTHDFPSLSVAALIVAVIYAACVARCLLPGKVPHIRVGIIGAMWLVTVIFMLLGVFGPAMTSITTKQDRLIDDNLQSVATSVQGYTILNSALPESLNQVELDNYGSSSSSSPKELVGRGLVEYKPNSKPAGRSEYGGNELYYELCVNYTQKREEKSGLSEDAFGEGDYKTIPNVRNHPAGKYCYKLKTHFSRTEEQQEEYEEEVLHPNS